MTNISTSAFGNWNAESATDIGTFNDACFDGRHVWCVSDTFTYAKDFFDSYPDDDKFVSTSPQVTNAKGISGGGIRIWPISLHRVLIVSSNGQQFPSLRYTWKIVDFFAGAIYTSAETTSYPFGDTQNHYQNGIVAMGCLFFTAGSQLKKFNLSTYVTSTFDIPARPQYSVNRHLSFDYDGRILIPVFNSLSIMKFDVETSAFSAEIRLDDGTHGANKEPDCVFTNFDKDIYVSSYKGMLSKVNPVSGVVTHVASFLSHVQGFIDTGSHFWFANDVAQELEEPDPPTGPILASDGTTTSIGRIRKSDLAIISTSLVIKDNGEIVPSDSGLKIEGFTGGDTIKRMFFTRAMTVPAWDGEGFITKTIPAYIWVVTGGGTVVFDASKLYRSPKYSIGATMMVSSGTYNYTGT